MVNFPDFEEQFEIFENLGALHVSVNLANVSRAPTARAQLLLTGLQLPILSKVRRVCVSQSLREGGVCVSQIIRRRGGVFPIIRRLGGGVRFPSLGKGGCAFPTVERK